MTALAHRPEVVRVVGSAVRYGHHVVNLGRNPGASRAADLTHPPIPVKNGGSDLPPRVLCCPAHGLKCIRTSSGSQPVGS